MDNIEKSNWLEVKEKTGTEVTLEEIDELWQESVQELMTLEKLYKEQGPTDYRVERDLGKFYINLWEMRDAAWKAVTDAKKK